MQYMVDSQNQGLSPLLPSLTPPHGNTPRALSIPFSSVLRRRPGEEHQLTPFLALHIRRKTPCLSDEGEFFGLYNELHIPNRRPGVAQLGPIKDWMKSWVASSCRLMNGISYLSPFIKVLQVNIHLSATGQALALLLDALQFTHTKPQA